MQQQEEAKLLEMYRAVPDKDKKMILGTLERFLIRANGTQQEEMHAIVGYKRSTAS